MKKNRTLFWVFFAACLALAGQQGADIVGDIMKDQQKPVMAVIEFRGSGNAQSVMPTFNQTLRGDLGGSGLFRMASPSVYPLQIPQQPQDFREPLPPTRPGGQPIRQGPWLTDWSGPPVGANYLTFGYTGIQGDQLVLFGWLFNVQSDKPANAQMIGKTYFGSIDDTGARKVAHEFAADILAKFGQSSLVGSKIYFVSDRTGNKQIWSMDFDGANQKPFAPYRELCTMPSVSPDGKRIAFTRFEPVGPQIMVHSLESGRRLAFVNPRASLNATASFTPDGQHVVFSSGLSGVAQIYLANIDGSGMRRISSSRAIEIEPKVNPKTGTEIAFISGRSGMPQLYRMNMDGADSSMLSTGEGEASNPSWSPNGKYLAFAWTRGYEPGNWNIFIMDAATRNYVQLTHGAGRNENPTWAPDGVHLAFSTNRGGRMQIWTMRVDGTDAKTLTTQGRNEKPVWSVAP
jgi:TolB protein